MELVDAIRRRRMVRALAADRVDRDRLDRLLDLSRRAPSAGNTQAVEFLVLDEPELVERYWSTTMRSEVRERFRWQELLRAPVLVVIVTCPQAYVDRYREPDKQRVHLGRDLEAWGVPYWWVDAGAVVQNLLLLAVDEGLGACLFGLFDHEDAVKATFGVPDDRRLVGTVALGLPRPDEPGRSSRRPRRPLAAIRHRGRWVDDGVSRPPE